MESLFNLNAIFETMEKDPFDNILKLFKYFNNHKKLGQINIKKSRKRLATYRKW